MLARAWPQAVFRPMALFPTFTNFFLTSKVMPSSCPYVIALAGGSLRSFLEKDRTGQQNLPRSWCQASPSQRGSRVLLAVPLTCSLSLPECCQDDQRDDGQEIWLLLACGDW